MKKLPAGIIEAAIRRHEDSDPLKIHPGHARQQERERRAYEILKAKLTREEIYTVESTFGLDAAMHFDVAYAMGLADGIATGRALSEAEGAHPVKDEAPPAEAEATI